MRDSFTWNCILLSALATTLVSLPSLCAGVEPDRVTITHIEKRQWYSSQVKHPSRVKVGNNFVRSEVIEPALLYASERVQFNPPRNYQSHEAAYFTLAQEFCESQIDDNQWEIVLGKQSDGTTRDRAYFEGRAPKNNGTVDVSRQGIELKTKDIYIRGTYRDRPKSPNGWYTGISCATWLAQIR